VYSFPSVRLVFLLCAGMFYVAEEKNEFTVSHLQWHYVKGYAFKLMATSLTSSSIHMSTFLNSNSQRT